MANVVGLDLKLSLNFCVFILPSAVRVTSERWPSLSTMMASVGFAPGLSGPTAITSGLPSSGSNRRKRQLPVLVKLRHADRAVRPGSTGKFSAGRRRSMSAAAIWLTPASVGKFLATPASRPACCKYTDTWPLVRLGHEQIGPAVAVDIRPQQYRAAPRRFCSAAELETGPHETRRTKLPTACA